LADGIVLERAGVPAVSICTQAFVIPAKAMADVLGHSDFEFVTIPHPIASLDADEIEARVREVVGDVARILTAR
jgi:hypothetical protein